MHQHASHKVYAEKLIYGTYYLSLLLRKLWTSTQKVIRGRRSTEWLRLCFVEKQIASILFQIVSPFFSEPANMHRLINSKNVRTPPTRLSSGAAGSLRKSLSVGWGPFASRPFALWQSLYGANKWTFCDIQHTYRKAHVAWIELAARKNYSVENGSVGICQSWVGRQQFNIKLAGMRICLKKQICGKLNSLSQRLKQTLQLNSNKCEKKCNRILCGCSLLIDRETLPDFCLCT